MFLRQVRLLEMTSFVSGISEMGDGEKQCSVLDPNDGPGCVGMSTYVECSGSYKKSIDAHYKLYLIWTMGVAMMAKVP